MMMMTTIKREDPRPVRCGVNCECEQGWSGDRPFDYPDLKSKIRIIILQNQKYDPSNYPDG